jgi:hypothetical protein
MAVNTYRGKAQISGVSGTVTVAAAAWNLLKESAQISRNFEEDIIKDETAGDCAWRASNQKDEGTIGFRLVDTGTPTTQANIETFCSNLLDAPYATIVLSGFKPAAFNGSYQAVSGQDLNLSNTTAGSGSIKLRKYVDSTQQTLSTTVFTPS